MDIFRCYPSIAIYFLVGYVYNVSFDRYETNWSIFKPIYEHKIKTRFPYSLRVCKRKYALFCLYSASYNKVLLISVSYSREIVRVDRKDVDFTGVWSDSIRFRT